jgi:2,4-dienoyl-CoA reductase-like NADH-dependent reductase (Old Yellow Enzyme family)
MSALFQPFRIQGLELPNRFVRSATFESCAGREGVVTPELIRVQTDLAEGGVGLIVAGVANVDASGRISPRQASLAEDRFEDGWRRLTDEVHQRGAKIAVQIFHAGREAALYQTHLGQEAVAPSQVPDDPYCDFPHRELRPAEIEAIVEAFGRAAGRVKRAGFDAVQIHGAHAYLLAQFLSPHANRRNDEWGGDLHHRLRLHREVYRAVRAEVGPDFPVLIKLGVADGFPGGLTFEEGLSAAVELAELGYDALEISQGLRGKGYAQAEFRTKVDRPGGEAYFRDWTRAVKAGVEVPVMMVGGLRDLGLMEEVIERGEADLVSLSRPLIREPHLVAEWRAGSRRRPACISCNQCYEALRRLEPLRCIQEEKNQGRP